VSREIDVVMTVSRVAIGYKESQCNPCICYFVSIWFQFFKIESISSLYQI